MDRNERRVPTVVIGVGGIGGNIVRQTFKLLGDYDKTFVSFIVLDTDVADLKKSNELGIPAIQTSEQINVNEALREHPEFLEWFPVNPLISTLDLTKGAGQIRALSRLAARICELDNKFDQIKTEMRRVNANVGQPEVTSINVVIVGSISGGTGAGLFIQLPFAIRKMVDKSITVNGIFIEPDVVECLQTDPYSEDAVYVNAYSCIKELNAFYWAQGLKDNEILFNLDDYNKGEQNIGITNPELFKPNPIPYDFLFLIGADDLNGRTLTSCPYYIERAAHIVRNQVLSRIGDQQQSIFVNKINGLIANQGMSRYCGAGIANAKYPAESIIKYCGIRWSLRAIEEFWYKLDEYFNVRNKTNKMAMLNNPTIEPLDKGDTYVEAFNHYSQDTDAISSFKQLFRETIIIQEIKNEDGTTRREPVDKITELMPTIENHITGEIDKTGIREKQEACRPDMKKLKNKDKVINEINRVTSNLREYKTEIIKQINPIELKCVEDIFPSDYKMALESKDLDYCVYKLLYGLHPISSRYLLYKLKKQLEEIAEEHKGKIQESSLRVFEEHDFDPVQKGTQDALSTASKVKPNISLPFFLATKFNDFIKDFENVADEQSENLSAYFTNKLKFEIYDRILKRVNTMLKVYEDMFDAIPTIIAKKKSIAAELEKTFENNKSRDILVYAQSEHMRELFIELVDSGCIDEADIPTDAKINLLQAFYIEMQKKVTGSISGVPMRLANPEHIFENNIIKFLEKSVIERGNSIIDLNVLDAIKKEIIFEKSHNPKFVDDGSEITATVSDVQNYFKKLVVLATPIIAVKGVSTQQLATFWGVNTEKMPKNDIGDVDEASTINLFAPASVEMPAVAYDDSFNRHELVCLRLICGLTVGNLVKYGKDKTAHKKYIERLATLNMSPAFPSANNAFKSTVHPHLDRRWHQSAYMPMLDETDELQKRSKAALAFFLSLALDKCRLKTSSGRTYWYYIKEGTPDGPEILTDGKVTPTTKIDLYRSFFYNDSMLEETLEHAEKVKEDSFRSRNAMNIIDDIKGQRIIESMIKNEKQINLDGKSTPNVFDVLVEINLGDASTDFFNFLIKILLNYFNEYCAKMIPGDFDKQKLALKSILDDIYSNMLSKGSRLDLQLKEISSL